ncbi:MAG: hypothetical protein LBT26_09145, partial [Clostridiales Family XIII bacterium]|nr:hypothetical protein [Clostridiales Family XIII bacterium]
MGKKRDLGVDGGAVVQSGDIVHDGDKLIIVASGQTGYGLDGGLTLTGLAATGNADEYEVGDPTGNRLRPSVSFAVKPATTKLDAPTLSSTPVSNTGTSITLTAPAGSAQDLTSLLQFRCATSESGLTDAVWQYSREFTGLTSGTSYWFQARNKTNKTDIWADSDPSNAVQITAGAAPATYYSVMLESGSNYTCEVLVNGVSKASGLTPGQSLNSAAASGDTVKIIPAPASGYGIFSVSANHVSQMTSTALPLADGGYSFTMPARHVYVAVNTATVKTVTVDPYEHGTVTTSADDKITAGTFVGGVLTVTAAPDEGYYLASLAYSTDDGETWTSIVTSANGGIIGDVSAPVTRIKAEFAASDHSLSITDEAELRAFATAVNAGD